MDPSEQFGEVVWQDKNFVVRAKVDQMGSLHIVVHRRESIPGARGREIVPVGYITGITALDVHC